MHIQNVCTEAKIKHSNLQFWDISLIRANLWLQLQNMSPLPFTGKVNYLSWESLGFWGSFHFLGSLHTGAHLNQPPCKTLMSWWEINWYVLKWGTFLSAFQSSSFVPVKSFPKRSLTAAWESNFPVFLGVNVLFAGSKLRFSFSETSKSNTSLKIPASGSLWIKSFSVRWKHRLDLRFLITSLLKVSSQAKSWFCPRFLTRGTP